MSIDYRKLASIGASTIKAPIVDSKNLLDNDSEGSPLDSILGKERISDTAQERVIILDNKAISRVMSLPRERRRAFLSKLSDSQRKRVLEQFQQMKVKDEALPFNEELLIYAFDQSLINYIYEPNDYNKGILDNLLKDNNLPEVCVELANVITSGDFDAESIADYVDAYKEYVKEHGRLLTNIDSALSFYNDASDFTEEEMTEEVEDEVTTAAETDAEKFSESPFDYTQTRDSVILPLIQKGFSHKKLIDAYNRKFFNSLKIRISDSAEVHKRVNKILDESISKALDDIEDAPFIDQDGNEVVDTEESSVISLLIEALKEFENGDPEKLQAFSEMAISETVDEPDESDVNEDENDDNKSDQNPEDVKPDDVEFEEVEDSKIKDGVQDGWDTGEDAISYLLDALEKASNLLYEINNAYRGYVSNATTYSELADYVERLASKLDDCATDLRMVEEPDESDDIEDSIAYAKSVLSGKPDQKVFDSLASRHKALQRFSNRKLTLIKDEFEPQSIVNPPLTVDEYRTMIPAVIPSYFDTLVKANYDLDVKSCEPDDETESFLINGTDSYTCVTKPYCELCKEIEGQDLAGLTRIVGSNCAPTSRVVEFAALTDNLNVIDNKFYKIHVNDSEWHFDSPVSCIKDVQSGTLKRCSNATENFVTIYGQKYLLTK